LKQKILKNINKTLENNQHMKINQLLIIRRLLLTMGSLLMASQLQADTLAYWNMDGSGATKTNVNTLGSSVSVTPIGTVNLNAVGTVTPVFNPALATGDNYAAMSRSAGPTPETVSLTQDFGNSTYFQFTLAPTGGQLLNITSLSFDAVAATTTTTANREFFLEANKTGFGTTSGNVLYGAGTQSALNPGGGINWSSTLIPFNDSAANTGPYSETLFSVDLSGNSLLQNISDSVTFRIYIGTDTTSQNLGFDNLTVNGSIVPAPEPSVYALAGLGLLLAIGKSRWMRKA
jgi:hypothetical protein